MFLGAGLLGETVKFQDILQGHDAFELVDIGAADHGERVDVRGAHALESDRERLIGMHVREFGAFQEISERFGVAVGGGLLQNV